jgi:SAM-dependent methyltransferase
MNISRPYQERFYSLSQPVRDALSRSRKAQKIYWLLETKANLSLRDSLCVDVGASSGLVASHLVPLFRHVVGLDYDEIGLLAAPLEVRQQVALLRGDGMAMPFASGSVDVVICAQVYEHVPDDGQLFAEIYRILRPGGLVFFSGPNWLFPIEPHYFLPFLHWLPSQWAARYLRSVRLGDSYYERSRHYWDLRRVLQNFIIEDVTLDVLQQFFATKPGKGWIIQILPKWIWRLLLPLFPNFNWLLRKPE